MGGDSFSGKFFGRSTGGGSEGQYNDFIEAYSEGSGLWKGTVRFIDLDRTCLFPISEGQKKKRRAGL